MYFTGWASRFFFWQGEEWKYYLACRGQQQQEAVHRVIPVSSEQHKQWKAINDGARRGVLLADLKYVNDIQDSEKGKI